jgi:uracil phosphoribosyltransferase
VFELLGAIMNNLIHHYMTQLRNRETSRAQFQQAADRLAHLIAHETAKLIPMKKVEVVTPLDLTANGVQFANSIILCPVLRSGLSLLAAFQTYFQEASVGMVGLERNEESAIARLYYCKLPPIKENDQVIILDPMLATGGSGTATIEILIQHGIKEENIILACLICCVEGRKAIETKYPKVKIIFAEEDARLNAKKFIMPGLGDFGDRYYGTVE